MGSKKRKGGGKDPIEKSGGKKGKKSGSKIHGSFSEGSGRLKSGKSERETSHDSSDFDNLDSDEARPVRSKAKDKQHQKSLTPSSSKSVGPCSIISVLLLLSIVSGGVYIYAFTDYELNEIIDIAHTKVLQSIDLINDNFNQETTDSATIIESPSLEPDSISQDINIEDFGDAEVRIEKNAADEVVYEKDVFAEDTIYSDGVDKKPVIEDITIEVKKRDVNEAVDDGVIEDEKSEQKLDEVLEEFHEIQDTPDQIDRNGRTDKAEVVEKNVNDLREDESKTKLVKEGNTDRQQDKIETEKEQIIGDIADEVTKEDTVNDDLKVPEIVEIDQNEYDQTVRDEKSEAKVSENVDEGQEQEATIEQEVKEEKESTDESKTELKQVVGDIDIEFTKEDAVNDDLKVPEIVDVDQNENNQPEEQVTEPSEDNKDLKSKQMKHQTDDGDDIQIELAKTSDLDQPPEEVATESKSTASEEHFTQPKIVLQKENVDMEEVKVAENVDEGKEQEAIIKQEVKESTDIPQPIENDQSDSSDSKENIVKDIDEERRSYEKDIITNKLDYLIRNDLDEAETLLQNNPDMALKTFDELLGKFPQSPRAQYGRAQALDAMAELHRSNKFLEECMNEYLKVFNLPDVPKELVLMSGRRAADRQTFRGWNGRAAKTMRRLLELYPEDPSLWNELGVKHLISGQNEDARRAFQQVLRSDPENGFALVHMGFIMKVFDNNNTAAIPYIQRGIATGAEGTSDGRFFFHLGDALQREGKISEAYEVYNQGAERGLFLSMWQRSLYNVDRLKSRPWWTMKQTGNENHLMELKKHWQTIRDEGLAQMNQKTESFQPEVENLREKGDWKQLILFQKGRKNKDNCALVPKTCALLEKFTEATGCSRGQIKYSVMQPGVHVWPHCGPTNCRIRAHLGLVVPEGPRIRVTDEIRTWKEGEIIVFDDSFEHEVWHDGDSFRLVLIVDMWHPELTAREKATLTPI